MEAVASGYRRCLGHVTRALTQRELRGCFSSPTREDGEATLGQSFTKGNAFSLNFVLETWPPAPFSVYVKARTARPWLLCAALAETFGGCHGAGR